MVRSTASLSSANQRRSAYAAAALARVQALELLVGQTRSNLLEAGRLRLQQPQGSLKALGAFLRVGHR